MWVQVEEIALYDRFGPGWGETRFEMHTARAAFHLRIEFATSR
jgi:hypothetical protein